MEVVSSSLIDVDAAVETGGDASVDGFTEDITDGLLDLSVNSLVKILIWVMYTLFVVSLAGFLSIKFIINITSTSLTDRMAVTIIKVPVIIRGHGVNTSHSLCSEVVLSLLAGLRDLIFLVGDTTGNVPYLGLIDISVGVALNVGGVGSIHLEGRLDDLSWDHLFSSSNNVLG